MNIASSTNDPARVPLAGNLAIFSYYDPNGFLFPAVNLHTHEISCAIGYASLRRLQETILRRLIFLAEVTGRMRDRCTICTKVE